MYRKYYLIIILLLATSLSASTRTVFSGTSGIEETWLDRENTSTNYGSATTMTLQNAFAAFSVALIRSLSLDDTIPTTANVIACSVYVYVWAITGTKQIETARVCKPWVEDEATNARWKSLLGGWGTDPVGSPGTNCAVCNNTTNDGGYDYEGTIATSANITATGYVAIPVDTCHANAWVSGSDVNNGVRLWDNAYGGNYSTITLLTTDAGIFPPLFVFIWEGGVPNARHSADGTGVRHSGDGASARHGG